MFSLFPNCRDANLDFQINSKLKKNHKNILEILLRTTFVHSRVKIRSLDVLSLAVPSRHNLQNVNSPDHCS